MSNGTNPTPLNSEEYGAIVGALLAQQAGQGMFGNPQAERAGVSPFRTLGKYDEGATAALYQPVHNADPETIQEYYRGANQNAFQRMGNAALAFVPGVALKTVQGIGHVGGAVLSLLPDSDITGYDNAWVNAVASLDERLREALPIHLQQSYGEGNLIQKLGTSTFWTKDFADGVEFLTSAMIPTGGFSKVGSIAKALSNTQRGARLGKVLADITAKTGINTSSALATTYNTVSEAYFEAKDARDQIREAAARQAGVRHYEQLPEDIREIVDQQSADAAARVFNANVAALAIPNFFETKWAQSILGKADNAAESVIRKQILSGEKKAEDIAAGINLRKATFKGMMTEGLWEENIQSSIQQYEQRLSTGEIDPESTSIAEQYAYGLLNNAWGFARFIPDLLTFGAAGTSAKAGSLQDEGATSVFLGSVLGGGMSTYAAVKENQALKKYAADVESKWGNLMKYKELTDKHLVDNIGAIYKTFGTIEKDDGTTIPNYINPKTGEKEYDVDTLIRRMISDYRNVAYFNEGSMADAADDPVWQRYNLDMSLASWVYRMRNDTDHEGFKEVLQYKTEIAENAEGDDVLSRNKDKLLAFSQAYDRAVASTQGLDEFIGPEYIKDFNAIYKRLNYFADIKDVMLQDLATSNPNLAQIEDLIQDNNELKDTLKKNKNQLRDDYLQAVKPMYELEKQVKDLHRDFLQATDVTTQEELGKKLAVAEYQYQEKRAEEGWLPEPSMSDAYTSDLRTGVEARTVYDPRKAQDPGVYPYRRNRQYDIGKEALVRNKLASDLNNLQKVNENDVKLEIIKDALSTADLNKGFVGTSKAELKGIQQELEKIAGELSTQTAKIGSELADAAMGVATRPMAEIQAEHQGFQTILREVEDTLLPQVDSLLQVEPTGAKYQKSPRIDSVLDQAKYDYFKETVPEFESARDTVENPTALDNFSSEQKLEDLRTQIDTTEVVFNNRDDISDQLKARVLAELEQAKKDLAKLEAAFQKNVKSRAIIQERASQEVGAQYNSIANFAEVKLILEQVFGENAVNLPKEFNAGTVAGVMAALDSAATDNQKKELKKVLTKIQDALYDRVKDLGIEKVQLDRLKTSHSKYIPWVTYDTMLPREIGMSTQNLPYIQLFIETKDVQTFFRDLEDNKYVGIPAEYQDKLKAWKEISTQLYGLDIFFDTLNSDVNLIEAFEAEKKQYEDSTEGQKAEEVISPTIQQILAIRKAIKFLTTPSSKNSNDHLIFIEGLAGTGKTKVVVGNIIRLYNKLTGNTLDSVYTISHTPKSSQILHEQVKQEGKGTTAQDFLAKQTISDLKILVIDEAPAFELSEIRKVLQKVKDYNDNVSAKDRIKILALGDPAQVTQQAYPFITQPALVGMHYTAPLTAIYRTNVGPIIDYFTNYRLNVQPVRNVKATANVPLSALPTTKNLVGVTGATQPDLLKQTAFRDAATTKLIIVEDEAAVTRYTAEAAAANAQNVDVIPYYKVGGMQVDEVYIDVRPSIFSRPIDYNRAIFTAASRATKFVYHNTSVITPRVNETLKAQTAETAKDILENGEIYTKSLDLTTNTINSLLGIKVVTKPKPPRKAPDPKKPVDTTVDEALQQESEVGYTDPVTPSEITANDGGTILPPPPKGITGIVKGAAHHALQYVTNAALSMDREGNFPNFTGNVRIVSVAPRRTRLARLGVWAEVMHNDRLKWKEIGVLGDKDFKDPKTGKALLAAVDGYGNRAMAEPRERGGYIQTPNQEDFEKATMVQATLQDWAPMTYVYSQDLETAEFNSPLDAAITTFFNGPGEPFRKDFIRPNGTVDWSALRPYAKVGIFKRNPGDPSDTFTKDAAIEAGNFVPELGIPYLVLNFNKGGYSQRTIGQGMGQQYIRLQNKGLSREHPHFLAVQDYYNDYQAFKALTGIEMGTEEYSVAISEAAAILEATKNEQGIPVLDFNPLLDRETHIEQLKEVGVPKEAYNLAIKLAKHIYGPEFKRVKFLSKIEAEEFIDNNTEGKYKIDPNYSDDTGRFALLVAKSENDYEQYWNWQVDPHKGPASKALSAMSRANPIIGGQPVRVTKTFLGRTITMGKSLITSKTTSPEFKAKFREVYNETKEQINEMLRQRGYPKLLDPLSHKESIEPWIEYLSKIYEDFGVGIPREEWSRLRTNYSAVSPINEGILEAIINFEGDTNVDVRTPIVRNAPEGATNKTGLNDYGDSLNIDINRQEIEKQVYSNLQSVQGSYATIVFEIQQQLAVPEQSEIEVAATEPAPEVAPVVTDKFKQLPLQEMVDRLERTRNVLSDAAKGDLDFAKKALKEKLNDEDTAAVKELLIAIYTNFTNDRGINMELEAPDTLTLITPEQAWSIARQIVPGIPTDVKGNNIGIRLVSRFLLQKYAETPKSTVVGRTLEIGQILLGTESGKVYQEALLHELFHYVYRNLMSAPERRKFDLSAERRLGKGVTEDDIANYWVEWFNTGQRPSSSFMDRVLEAINWFLDLIIPYRLELEDYFKAISKGKYNQERYRPWTGAGNNMSFIIDNFGDIDSYRHARDFILNRLKKYKKEGVGGLPVTDEYAYKQVHTDAEHRVRELNQSIDEMEEQVEAINQYYDFTTETPTADLQQVPFRQALQIRKIFNEVYKKALPEAKKERNALSKALGYNVKTRRPIFFEIVSNEFTSWNVVSEQEIAERIKLSELEDELLKAQALTDLSQTALKEQIEENENVDPHSRMSDSVKLLLSSVTYEDETTGTTKRISPGFAFLKMLQNFMELEFSSYSKNGQTIDVGEAVIEQLEDMLKNRSYSLAEEELLYMLIDLVENAYYPSINSNYNPADVNIVAEQKPGARHASYHLIYYDTAESILEGQARVALNEISTLEQARDLQRQNSTLKVISLPANNVDLSYLYQSALEAGAPLDILRPREDTDAAKAAFKDMYDRLEAKNALAEMYSLFGSQKETHLMIAQIERKYGDVNIKYISARDLGIRVNIKRELGIRLAEFHEGLIEKDSKTYPHGLKSYLKEDGKQLIKDLKATTAGTRLSAIETFFTQLGLAAYVPTIPTSEVPDVAKTIEELLNSFDEVGKKYNTIAKEEDGDIIEGETQLETITLEDVLDSQNARLNDLSRLLSRGTELTRASSVKDAEGKPIYKFNNSHYQYQIFNLLYRINDNTFFKGGRKARKYLSKFLPEFIKTEYFQNNIFSQGINQIHSTVGYHDAITQIDSGYTTPLQQENVYDRYTREFSAGFLSQLINSSGDYYRQFFYPPSHRSKVLNVQLGLLTPDQVKEGIRSAIKQFRLSHNDFKDIKGFKALDYTNFSILENVLNDPELNLTLDSDIDTLTDYVYQELLFVADEVADHIITNKVGLPTNLGFGLEIAKRKGLIDKESLTAFDSSVKLSLPQEFKTRKYDPKSQETEYLATKAELLPMVHAFVMNNYINGYFANQLILGDNRFYKGGDDVVKRNAGPSAAGQVGLIGDLTAVPEKYTLAVLEDDTISFENIKEFLGSFITDEKELAEIIEYFEEGDVDITDAQGFMTPNRWRQVQRMYGRSYGLGHVMKPIHYEQTTTWVPATELDNKSEEEIQKLLELPYYKEDSDGNIQKLITHPIYVKYSSINLSNELVERFPTLALLRQRMEIKGMDELTFTSAIKVGAPKATASLADFLAGNDVAVKTYQLSNKNYRMQLNPYSDTDTYVTIYSQLMYFLNILGKNNSEADTVYKIVSALIELGITDAEELLSTTSENPSAVKNFILKSLRSKDSQRARELLEANISINNPVIEQKAITAIASGIEKLTTKIKFKGSKMVLQSSYGLANYGNINNIDNRTIEKGKRLQYKVDPKTKTLYAEVIFPAKYLSDSQKAAIKRGESLFVVEDFFGFRIPSTELHSAVPLRIVDYYDDLGTNVIVAPAELVPLHGSDFDVDSLFIIEREAAQREYTLPDIGNIKGLYFSEGTYIGYKKKSPKSNQLVINDNTLIKLEGYIVSAQAKLKTLSGKNNKEERAKYRKALTEAKDLRKMFLRNKITDTMLEVITAERNRSRMLTPISMKELTQEAERFDTKTNLDLNHPVQRYRAFELLQDGQLLVGEFANDVKSLAYMVRAGEDGARPKLREKDHVSIRIDNTDHTFDDLREYDIDNKQTWQRLDAAINAAIDNAKVLILPRLGVTKRTGKAFAGLLGIGVPLKVVADLINSPVIKQLQGPDSRRKISDEIHEVKKKLENAAEELVYTTLDASKINAELDLSDISKLSAEDIQLAYNILSTYERGHNVGTSLQSMSKFLNIVREFPTTAEGIEEIYNAYGQIFNTNENLEKTLSVPDSLQLRRGVPQYIDPKTPALGDTSLEMNEGFSFQINKFFEANPHIFSTWKAFLKLRNLVRNNFILHSQVTDELITALGVTKELRLDKGMPDSSGPKNRVLHKRELSKYVLSQIYSEQLNDEPEYKYTNKYGKERILRKGSAFSQHFAKKIIALKKWNKQQIVDDPNYKGNTFLQNLSVVKSAGVNLWTIRFSKGTSVTQEEIEELQADFENLRTLTVENGKVRRLLPSEIPLTGEFTQLQEDFVKYSVVNYGFKFSAANYAYFLPPSIYQKIDNQFASKWKDLVEDGGETIKDHFEISMIAHHRDKLNWIPSYKSEKIANGSQVIELGFGETKVENNYAGVDTDEGGFIFYDRKYKQGAHELPDYYKEGNGWQATAFKKVHTTEKDGDTFVYYQRIARPADTVYQTVPSLVNKDLKYDVSIAYDARSLTVQVDDTNTRTIHLPYDVSKAVGEIIELIDRNDYTRMDGVPVRITKVEKVEDDWKVTLESVDLPPLKFDIDFEVDLFSLDFESAKLAIEAAFKDKSTEEAKDVYRKLAKQYHPDLGGSTQIMQYLINTYEKFSKPSSFNRTSTNYYNTWEERRKEQEERARKAKEEWEKAWAERKVRWEREKNEREERRKREENERERLRRQGKYFIETKHKLEEDLYRPTFRYASNNLLWELAKKFDRYTRTSNKTGEYVYNDIKLTVEDFIFGLNNRLLTLDTLIRFSEDRPELFDEIQTKLLQVLKLNIHTTIDVSYSVGKITFGYDPQNLIKWGPHTKGAVKMLKNSPYARSGGQEVFISDVYLNLHKFPNQSVREVFSTSGLKLLTDAIGHEMLHVLTAGELVQNTAFKTEIQTLYNIAKKRFDILKPSNKEIAYGMTNIFEFVAQFYNSPAFRDWLDTIKLEKKSLLQKIIDVIARLFKGDTATVKELLERSLEYRFAKDMSLSTYSKNSIRLVTIKDSFDQEDLKLEQFQQASEEFKETVDPATQKSVYEKAGKLFTRVSDILDIFKNRSNDEPWYEYVAKKVWGNKSPETVLDTDEGRMNREEYAKILQEKDTKGKMRGKIIHAMIQQFLHPEQMAEIQTKINGYMKEGDYEPYQFTWVTEAMSDILISTKVNIFDDIPQEQKDQILSEVTVGDDLLGLAGTIDMLVKHADDKYSIIDFKTGFGFRKPSPVFAKYFNAPGRAITASQQDMAGLQIALYAFLLKLNNPDIKFRELRVRWIPSKHHVKAVPHLENVDIENYLPIIKQFLSREPAYKQIWEELQKRDNFAELFSASTYIDGYSPRITADIEKGGYSPEQQAELYLQKLKELVQYKIVSVDEDKKYIDQNIIELTKNVTELLGDAGISYEAVKEGSSVFDEWVGNMYDSTDPYIQLAVRFYEERKQRADIRYDTAYKGFLARMTPVYQSYQKRNKYAVTDKIPIVKGTLNFTNYDKLYDPMYKVLPDGGVQWNATEQDWQDAIKRYKESTGHTLTEQEIKEYKNLLKYIQDQYAQFFLDERSQYKNPEGKAVALWNRIATTRVINDKEHLVTNGELFNGQTTGGKSFSAHAKSIPFSYDPNTLVPVVPITGEEVHRRNGFLSKKYADYLKERYGSMYVEQYFEQWYNDEMALPFKFLPNERILADKSFSVNVELQFDKFMRSMIYKEELDDVYALYKGLQYSLEAKDAASGMPAFAGTAELLKYNAEMQVRGRTQRQFKSKLFKRGGNKDWVKILGTFQKVVSAPIMWLKPITGTANGVFTYMYTVKEAIKGSVIQKMSGIENHAADFTTADLTWATTQYFDMQLDAMKGNLRNNKMFLFLKRLGYLPDTYKWATDRNQLLTIRNKALSSSAMYMFHTIPEEAVASIIMAAQLRTLKIANDHPTHGGKSLWDMYKPQEFKNADGTTYTDLVWEKDSEGKPVVRGYINTSKDPKNPSYKELTELSSREVQRLKYVYQRMHGGYRQDERVKLEYFIMGRLFLQFKKYLPTILRNIGQSKGLSDSLGYYKELEKKDGVSVLEWQQEMIEGRWRVLLKTASNFLGVKAQFDTPTNSWQRAINTIVPNKNEDYSWKELSAQQKAALVDGVVSAATMGILIAGYTRIFGIGAGDSDDSWAKIIDRIINDYTQQYNPLELMKNTINNLAPVSGRKLYKTADSLWTFVWAAMFNDVTASGDIRGWAELRRSIPFLSSYRDIIYFLENREQENLTDYIFTKGIN